MAVNKNINTAPEISTKDSSDSWPDRDTVQSGQGFTRALKEESLVWIFTVLSALLPRPIRASKEKLFIGNLDMNYFIGAISEIAINNKPLEKNDVEQTWNSMK